MSEKQKGGIRKCLPVVLEALKKGIDIGALRDKGDCRHDTLYAIKDILSDAKLIYEENGKWYYLWKKEKDELLKDYQEFKNVEEYVIKLSHSSNLVKNANNIDSYLHMKDSPYFLQHLETGYPDIYELYKKWEEHDAEKEKIRKTFNKEVEEIASEKGFKILTIQKTRRKKVALILKDNQITSKIFESVKRHLREGIEVELIQNDVGIQDPIILDYLAGNKCVKSYLEKIIKNCIQSKSVKSICSKLVSKEDEVDKEYSKLVSEIRFLAKKIEDGEPLRGICERCPRVTIGREED